MALVRLEAHGVGPFEDLVLDLSDGYGNPHLGPHVLAGVNGSGKTTALRAIAWPLSHGAISFPAAEWKHSLRAGSVSVAEIALLDRTSMRAGAAALAPGEDANNLASKVFRQAQYTTGQAGRSVGEMAYLREGVDPLRDGGQWLTVSTYSPTRALRYLDPNERARSGFHASEAGLSFEHTVENAQVQGWIVDLFSRIGLLGMRQESAARQEALRASMEILLTEIADEPVRIDMAVEYELAPMVRFRGQLLNFSQLPDGVRWIVGLVADFLRRLDSPGWAPELGNRRPAILMIDEIDAHLHPRWQRTILPALKKALPEVQIIVTTHSPFVITSCPGARIHVLDVDDQGRASARPPIDAPIGESINATMKDIFGVSSRFDIQTERDLDRWNELKKKEYIGKLVPAESDELSRLIEELSERSQELRSIVGLPPTVPDSVVQALLSQ